MKKNQSANQPTVDLVSWTRGPLETILCAWFNSRDVGETWTVANLWDRLQSVENTEDAKIFHRLMKDKVGNDTHENGVDMFYDIMAMDIPVTEFVHFNFSFSNVPRTFVDQLDRTRQAAFWEQSVRVLDLSHFARDGQYFTPPEVASDKEKLLEYQEGMEACEDAYRGLIGQGVRPELARGVIPMHVNVRADMSISFRTLVQMVRKRACFFAQGSYWEPVLSQMVDLVCGVFPDVERTRELFSKLPCDMQSNECKCPYRRDLMDRLVDHSNPICPILYTRELNDSERSRTVKEMTSMYGKEQYVQLGVRYLKTFRPQWAAEFKQDVRSR